jgi:hypothetical protein
MICRGLRVFSGRIPRRRGAAGFASTIDLCPHDILPQNTANVACARATRPLHLPLRADGHRAGPHVHESAESEMPPVVLSPTPPLRTRVRGPPRPHRAGGASPRPSDRALLSRGVTTRKPYPSLNMSILQPMHPEPITLIKTDCFLKTYMNRVHRVQGAPEYGVHGLASFPTV